MGCGKNKKKPKEAEETEETEKNELEKLKHKHEKLKNENYTLYKMARQLQKENLKISHELNTTSEELNAERKRNTFNPPIVVHTASSKLTNGSANLSDPNEMQRVLVNNGSTNWFRKKNFKNVLPQKHPKDARLRHTLISALKKTNYLNQLKEHQLLEIVNYMTPLHIENVFDMIPAKLFEENDVDPKFYVISDGEIHLKSNGTVLQKLRAGSCFGEEALFFKAQRKYEAVVVEPSTIWRLNRQSFYIILSSLGKNRFMGIVNYLKNIPLLSGLSDTCLARLASVVKTEVYNVHDIIVQENDFCECLYIVDIGEVDIFHTMKTDQCEDPGNQFLKKVSKSEYFADMALQGNFRASFTAVARVKVQVLSLDRSNYLKQCSDETSKLSLPVESLHMMKTTCEDIRDFANLHLPSITKGLLLAKGTFDSVVYQCFVKKTDHPNDLFWFAMKGISKGWIERNNALPYIEAEKKVWMELTGSQFICQLYGTQRDEYHLFFLMQLLPGGDLQTHLNTRSGFALHDVRFYAGCMACALEYIHSKGILHRDVQPKNFLLDASGYLKLVDFTFAKNVSKLNRTFTFCGSPYYLAPEVLSLEGYDYGCDIWSYGVTLMEINCGKLPFTKVTSQEVLFTKIAKGFEGFDIPNNLNENVKRFAEQLCEKNIFQRLGYEHKGWSKIRNHSFFDEFNWRTLLSQTMPPPITPVLASPNDTKYFRVPEDIIIDFGQNIKDFEWGNEF